MRYNRSVRYLTFFLMLLAVNAGCINVGQEARRPTRMLILSSMDNPGIMGSVPAQKPLPSLGVGPVRIPDYLDRPQIVLRVSDNELEPALFATWGEPLDQGISRVLTDNLLLLLKTKAIYPYPWKGDISPDMSIELDVFRFDAEKNGTAVLIAGWAIRDARNQHLFHERRAEFSRPVDGESYDAVAKSLSGLLEDFSRKIVTVVQRETKGVRK